MDPLPARKEGSICCLHVYEAFPISNPIQTMNDRVKMLLLWVLFLIRGDGLVVPLVLIFRNGHPTPSTTFPPEGDEKKVNTTTVSVVLVDRSMHPQFRVAPFQLTNHPFAFERDCLSTRVSLPYHVGPAWPAAHRPTPSAQCPDRCPPVTLLLHTLPVGQGLTYMPLLSLPLWLFFFPSRSLPVLPHVQSFPPTLFSKPTAVYLHSHSLQSFIRLDRTCANNPFFAYPYYLSSR